MSNSINIPYAHELLPNFKKFEPEYAKSEFDKILTANRLELEKLLKSNTTSWDSLLKPLQEMENKLENVFSPIRHLNSVMNNDKLRKIYNDCLIKLTEYTTELGQNTRLFKAINQVKKSRQFSKLSLAQQKAIDNALRDFKLSGVALPKLKKKRFKKISSTLSTLGSQFSENVLDVTNAWHLHINKKSKLKGLPPHALELGKKAAEDKNLKGYVLNLEFPLWQPVMQYAEDRKLRQKMYKAYVTRASDLGPHSKKHDNSKVMHKILKLKQEQAELLGFKSYAGMSLTTKMAKNPDKVLEFLTGLLNKSKDQGLAELQELKEFARSHGVKTLKPWDVAFFSEKLKLKKFNISSEKLRDWFLTDKVISGMFELCANLFSVEFVELDNISTWHKDVRVYAIKRSQNVIAFFYLDLYARANKRGGAWMDECRNRLRLDNNELQLPAAYLTCNFSPPVKNRPSLLSFEEVTTLFHEFGHGLQHMLTKIEVSAVSGINGVEWDAVELPSQFLENFCWQPEVIPMISAHYKTGKPLPAPKLKALIKAKNFQSATAILRQLEFGLFDIKLHMSFKNQDNFIENTLAEVRADTALLPAPKWNRFANSFSHIFAGGYAAGYYSYKWAEVLSADAFSLFETFA